MPRWSPCVAQSGIKDLGIHTEMLTDGCIDLVNVGCAAGSGQGGVQLRARLEVRVQRGHTQPGDGLLPRRRHQLADVIM